MEGGSAFQNSLAKRILWHNREQNRVAVKREVDRQHSALNLALWVSTKRLLCALFNVNAWLLIAVRNILVFIFGFSHVFFYLAANLAAMIFFALFLMPVTCSYIATANDPTWRSMCTAGSVEIQGGKKPGVDAIALHLIHTFAYTIVDIVSALTPTFVMREAQAQCARMYGENGLSFEDFASLLPIKRVYS